VAKRYVLEQKLGRTIDSQVRLVYEKSILIKMNDLDLFRGRIKVMSTIALQ